MMLKHPSSFLQTPPVPSILPCLVQARLKASWLLKTKTTKQQLQVLNMKGEVFKSIRTRLLEE